MDRKTLDRHLSLRAQHDRPVLLRTRVTRRVPDLEAIAEFDAWLQAETEQRLSLRRGKALQEARTEVGAAQAAARKARVRLEARAKREAAKLGEDPVEVTPADLPPVPTEADLLPPKIAAHEAELAAELSAHPRVRTPLEREVTEEVYQVVGRDARVVSDLTGIEGTWEDVEGGGSVLWVGIPPGRLEEVLRLVTAHVEE